MSDAWNDRSDSVAPAIRSTFVRPNAIAQGIRMPPPPRTATMTVPSAVALPNGAEAVIALRRMRPDELYASELQPRGKGQLREGIRYVRGRPDLLAVLFVIFCLGTFGLNFQITNALMATQEFHRGAGEYGLLGSAIAPTLFGIALLCCGLNSTVTATMAGQIVMEGFLDIRLPPWLRRLVTRLVAIVPAILVTLYYGESGTAKLLILSQVILSLQLPFAIIPLVMITANRGKMGALRSPLWLTLVAAVIAAIVVTLNVKLIVDFVLGNLGS